MRKKKLNFIDAVEMHNQYPETFEVPSDREIALLQPGVDVKVGVLHKVGQVSAERFWATIKEIDGDTFTLEVDNVLVNTRYHGLKYGDIFTVQKKNIMAIYEQEKPSTIINAFKRFITE